MQKTRRDPPYLSKWIAVSWALQDMGAERTLMASLHKRGSWAAWVANRSSFYMEFLTAYCPAHRGLQYFRMMGLLVLYRTRSYLIFVFWCAAVQQKFSHGRKMVPVCTSMLPVVSRTTGQDERLLYQTWMTQFSEQDVLLREWEREQKTGNSDVTANMCKNIWKCAKQKRLHQLTWPCPSNFQVFHPFPISQQVPIQFPSFFHPCHYIFLYFYLFFTSWGQFEPGWGGGSQDDQDLWCEAGAWSRSEADPVEISSQLHWIHETLKSLITCLTLGFRVTMDPVHWFYVQIKSFFDWSCRFWMRYRDKLCRASEV